MEIRLLIKTVLLRVSEFTGLERDPEKKRFKETREYKPFITVQPGRYCEPAVPAGRRRKLQAAKQGPAKASHTQNQVKTPKLKGRAGPTQRRYVRNASGEPRRYPDTSPFLKNSIFVFFQLQHCKISRPSFCLCSHLARDKEMFACVFLTKKASLNSKRQGNCFRS